MIDVAVELTQRSPELRPAFLAELAMKHYNSLRYHYFAQFLYIVKESALK